MSLDPAVCYRALAARDARFDGRFFVGVATTGIYCRPVCRARTPRAERCRYFRSPAEAERAGFRACLRCRPELAPGRAPVDAVPRLVARAVERIEEGCLNGAGVERLAAELGVSARHLRRALEEELGVSPVELAQSRRLAFAKRLLHDSDLPLAQVAAASGFRSLRRFNASFAERFARPPSALRLEARGEAPTGAIALRLDYRPPLAWEPLAAFLGARAIPGVERVADGVYSRAARFGPQEGVLTVRHDSERRALVAEVPLSLAGALMPIAARLRALFDLDADPATIDAHLARDRRFARLVRRRPGLRLPGAFDRFETTIRAVLGQQVSVRAATTLAGRLAGRLGRALEPGAAKAGVERTFPSARALARAGAGAIAEIGIPAARAETVAALARARLRGALRLERGASLEGLPGIGAWTAGYVAMRALADPDAFPAGDLALRRALGESSEIENLRPWRAYAAIHLWTEIAQGEMA